MQTLNWDAAFVIIWIFFSPTREVKTGFEGSLLWFQVFCVICGWKLFHWELRVFECLSRQRSVWTIWLMSIVSPGLQTWFFSCCFSLIEALVAMNQPGCRAHVSGGLFQPECRSGRWQKTDRQQHDTMSAVFAGQAAELRYCGSWTQADWLMPDRIKLPLKAPGQQLSIQFWISAEGFSTIAVEPL